MKYMPRYNLKFIICFCFLNTILFQGSSLGQETQKAISMSMPIEELEAELLARLPGEIYVDFEQNFNVHRRLKYASAINPVLMSEKQKEPVKFYLFELPEDKVKVYESQFPSEIKDQFLLRKEGKVLIPIHQDYKTEFLIRWQQRPITELSAYKLVGHASFYIPAQDGFSQMTIKYRRFWGSDAHIGAKSVIGSDFISSHTQFLSEDFQNDHLREPLAISLPGLGREYTLVFREMPIPEERSSRQILPGFGLLGCEACLEILAKKSGEKSAFQWKKNKLMPLLGRVMAQYHYKLGISLESHTQNILFDVDFSTGEIHRILLRDLSDILINPAHLLASGNLQFDRRWLVKPGLNLQGRGIVDYTVPESKDSWYHSALYLEQALASHVNGSSARLKMYDAFMASYIEETKQILQQTDLNLNSFTKDILDFYAKKQEALNFSLQEQLGRQRGSYTMMLALALKDIMLRAEEIRLEQLSMKLETSRSLSTPEALEYLDWALSHNMMVFSDESIKAEISESYKQLSSLLQSNRARLDQYYHNIMKRIDQLRALWKTIKLRVSAKIKFIANSGVNSDAVVESTQRMNEVQKKSETKFRKNRVLAILDSVAEKHFNKIDKLSFRNHSLPNSISAEIQSAEGYELFLLKSINGGKVLGWASVPKCRDVFKQDLGGK